MINEDEFFAVAENDDDEDDIDDEKRRSFEMMERDALGRDEVERLTKELSEQRKRVFRANILVIGKTGSGKSSIVNAVFGGAFAQSGVGEPVTKCLRRYAPEGERVVVYDTRGLESGDGAEFESELQTFLSNLRASRDIADHLHVVWYVVDMSAARFHRYEARLCALVLRELPLVVVLNKVDTASAEQVRDIRRHIAKLGVKCDAVFEVVAARHNFDVDACTRCKSADVRFRRRTRTAYCDADACGHSWTLGETSGLGQLVAATVEHLPELACDSFIGAQRVSASAQIVVAARLIEAMAPRAVDRRAACTLLLRLASRLAVNFSLPFFPAIVSQEIGSVIAALSEEQSALARAANSFINMLRPSSSQYRRHSLAIFIVYGVELCRLLSDIKMRMLCTAIAESSSSPSSPSSPSSSSSSPSSLSLSLSSSVESPPIFGDEFALHLQIDSQRIDTCAAQLQNESVRIVVERLLKLSLPSLSSSLS
jgi:predicted GTPase